MGELDPQPRGGEASGAVGPPSGTETGVPTHHSRDADPAQGAGARTDVRFPAKRSGGEFKAAQPEVAEEGGVVGFG